MRTNVGDNAIRLGRLRKAEQFATSAEVVIAAANDASEVADAYVTLCIHSGIASADVICIRKLGVYASGDSHTEAVALLEQASSGAGKYLSTLLALKTRAGYGHQPVNVQGRARAERAMTALLSLAR